MANTATLKPSKLQVLEPPAAPAAVPPCTFAMLSDRGRVRHANQDACAALPEVGAFIVCDGIGGAAAGEVASHLASQTFLQALSPQAQRQPRRIPPKSSSNVARGASHPHARLSEAVRAANHAVFRHSRKSPSLHGMGTTLVAALLDFERDDAAVPGKTVQPWLQAPQNPILWLAHVGDSRCYLLREGTLHLLTQDHSLIEEQIRAGTLSRAQAAASPIRNIITRALGTQSAVEPDIARHPMRPGDLYLLASDGLTRDVTDLEITAILNHESGLEPACHALIDAANAHGGHDNITVLLLGVP